MSGNLRKWDSPLQLSCWHLQFFADIELRSKLLILGIAQVWEVSYAMLLHQFDGFFSRQMLNIETYHHHARKTFL